jgi:hypothetical protein
MGSLLFGLVAGSGLTWAFMELRRDGYWREFSTRRRGSNPPPPAGPPEQPLTAQLIRYWAWEQEQARRAWLDDPIRFDEGQVQRGNGHGGPTTPKPPIKPQPPATQPAQPVAPAPEVGEVRELVAFLTVGSSCGGGATLPPEQCSRAAALLQQLSAPAPAVVPAALSDALLQAECALSDIAEGGETNAAPNTFEWAEQRCVKALDTIRPVMRDHGIRTSEWPGCGFSPPQPAPPAAPAGGLVERLGEIWSHGRPLHPSACCAVLREVAAWLRENETGYNAARWLEQEAGR